MRDRLMGIAKPKQAISLFMEAISAIISMFFMFHASSDQTPN